MNTTKKGSLNKRLRWIKAKEKGASKEEVILDRNNKKESREGKERSLDNCVFLRSLSPLE